ncbi:DUF3558 domain-containing protein [Actinophytocola oryzae]|uniref:Uncharacterized protein DUF3558 n=1 Tax=Actinophytocola oryzae TaxID=502181 RepID=A0A4R7UVF9_9PSEU|nr:DUF3558 domain-containing protein [Actinophytocola oryzae]TDV40699.1 uncharacterized protein DUF3558 [Actinophytocola oryzae]
MAAAVGLAVLTVLSACDSATAGQPEPKETTSRSAPESTEEPTSETEAPDYSLARLCELLSPEEAEQLGGSAEGKKTNSVSDGHAVCQWSDKITLVVGSQNDMTTASAETGPGITLTRTTIDGLTAVQQVKTEPVTVCQVMVELPSGKLFTSAVSVLSAGEGQYDPCQVATQASNLIIPRVKDQ